MIAVTAEKVLIDVLIRVNVADNCGVEQPSFHLRLIAPVIDPS